MKQQTKHLLSRLSSLALTLAIIISLCCVLMPNAVSSAWNGTIAASFASGTGTQSNPYVINTESQMGYFLKQLASGVTYDGLYIQLGRNLDMTGGTWNYTHGYAFNGTFNGRGYTITADCPLFDDIGAGGSVVGLNYTTAHVQLGRTPLCDVNNGLISSCVVWADVYLYDSPTIYLGMICTTNNGTVESCGAVGSVVAKGDDYSAYAAMVCQNKGTMKGCYSAITVSAVGYGKYSGEDWDPLALRTAAESSYYNAELYTGSVLSGVGMTTADMQSQAFLDSLQGTSVPGTKWVTGEHGYPALANCSTDSAYVSGHQGENTIVYNSSGSSFYLYSTRSGATVYYTTDGSDPTTSSSRSSVSSGSSVYVSGDKVLNLVSYYSGTYGAPTRVSFISLPGSGTASDPYQIRTLLQLSTLRMYPDKHFVLKNNITCASSDFVFGGTCAGGWTPVESFSGTLDGQGYAISGLRGNLGGLTDTNTGTIQNLRMLDHRLVSGDGYGVIAASNSGTIDGCYVCSAFTLTDLPNVSAGYVDYAGGIASYNSGTISGCRVEGLVIHRGMSRYSQSYFGGICGYSGGTIKNCFVNATLLMLQNEHGDNAYIGGVVGRGSANNCRSDVRIVMRSSTDYTLYVGGIVGNDPYVGGNASACIADTVDLSLQISGYLNPPVTSYPFAGNYNNCYYLSSSQLPSDCPNLDFTANWMSSDEGLIPQNVMDADGHRWVPTSTPIDPTCTAKGDMPVKCSVCGTTDILIQQALGHKHITYTSNGDATCLEDGTKTSSCVRCGVKDTITDELSALGHAFTTYESNGDATCLEDGTKTSFCDRCFEIDTVADEGSALGHSFTSYESNGDATCLEDGTKTAVCDRCDVTDTVTDEGSATGHAYGEYVSNNDFSCTEDGTMTATCAACGETETVADEGSAPGHAYGEYISNNDFTCTVDGTKTATCAVCGETDTVTDEGSAPGHAYGDYVSNNDFTCTTDGTKTATCAACGETDTVTDEGSATGHAYSDYISNTDFTCTTDGTKTSTCANCGDAITVTDEGSATGHNFVEGVCEYCQLQEISASGTCGAKLTWVLDYNGVLTISGTGAMSSWSSGSSPWYAYKDHILSIVIEEGATTIGASAFCDLSKVTALTLPEGITTINTGALWNCSGLTELSIPASVTSIAAMPFRGCSSLSTVLVDEENTAYCADASGVVYSKDLTRLVAAPGGLTGSYAIGSDVTAIEKGAFFSCSGVNELTFSGNAPAIGANAFYGVTAKCVYPGKYDSWTEDVMQQYGGTITWEAYYPQIIASGECGDDLTWTLDSEGLLAIEGTGSTYGWHSSSRAPWWNYREQILSVKIGEGMTRLGGSAFYSCPNIVTVELPSTLTYTGSAAFWFCDNLKEITIPASVKTINDDMPFRGCVSLEFITVESGNTAYCNDASGVLYTKDMTTLVAAPCKLSGAYQIPDGVTSISQAAFFYCCELISVTMPDSVTFMDEEAFSQCTALSSVRLSKGLTTIPDSAFSNCSSLTAVDIPEGVLSISRAAFAKCSSLTELTLPDGLTTIGQCAFGYLNDPSGLKKLVIPASVTTLENQALNGLVECEIWFMGDAPATWGTSVFYGSTVTCYYPAGNATWTADVMQNYGGTITWTARAEIIASGKCGDDLTWTLDSEGVLTIEGTGDMWDTGSDELWPDYLTSIKTVTIGEGVTSVGYAAFLGCTNLTTVTMADSVTSISWFAFYNCSALTSVDMSENVTFISSQAFAGCSSLAGLTIPEGVSSIQHNTFNGCSSLTGLVIPEGVTSIGDSAFQNCSSLTELTIPDSVTSIGNGVFRGCSGLTEVYFTGSAPTFGTSVFKDVTATCYYPAAASGWTEDVMQDYGGTLTWVAVQDKFDIGFASMTMGNSLAINFAFEKASMEDWTGCYAEIRKTYADGREDVVVTVPYTEWKSANISGKAHYYVTFDGIAAKEMTDTVYVTIYNTDGTAVSTTKTDSVRDQSMRALVKEGVTDAEKTMIVDMLNYGAAAQDYFGYGAEDLANAQMSEDQAAYASESVPCANNRVGTGVFKASNVILKSNIQMIFAFTGVNESNYAVVTFSNHRGQAKTINIPGSEFGTNGSLRTVTVDALVVADGRQAVTCVVYDANGNEVGRVTDSLEFYTARNNGKDILFTRMMQYSDSAYAYFHK